MINKKAFTLVELLTVIVIIGILAVLLVPALERIRENTSIAQCANNLRQIGVAFHLYVDDHNETFPIPVDSPYFGGKQGLYGGPKTAQRPLNPYLDVYSDADVGAIEVFHCPSDNRQMLGCGGTTSYGYFGDYGNSYWMNEALNGQSMLSIKVPHSKLMVAMDTVFNWDTAHGGTPLNFMKVNVVFLDGHVKMHNYTADSDWPPGTDPSKPIYEYIAR